MRAKDWARAIALVLSCYESMRQTNKIQMQVKYFEKEAVALSSTDMAKRVLNATFHQLDIIEDDKQIILEGFPTIAHIIDATEEEMQSNSPADMASIMKITSFFGCETPKL